MGNPESQDATDSAEVDASAGIKEALFGDNADVVTAVDNLLDYVIRLGSVRCEHVDATHLQFTVAEQHTLTVDMQRSMLVLRTMCARLGVIAGERSGQSVSPYGGEANFVHGQTPVSLSFSNTPDSQFFHIVRGNTGGQGEAGQAEVR